MSFKTSRFKRFPTKATSISRKNNPIRMKCKVGNFQCGATCKPIEYYSKKFKEIRPTKCGANPEGMAKSGLEWLKDRQERVEKINKRLASRKTPKPLIQIDSKTGRLKPNVKPQITTATPRLGIDNGGSSDTSDRRVRESREERITLARRDITPPSDPSVIPESLRQHLTETQIHGVSLAVKSMENTGGFLLADGTGVGKSRQQLAIAKIFADQGQKVLIISPTQVINPDYKKGTFSGSFLDDSKAIGLDVSLTKDSPLEVGKVAIGTYENLGKLKDYVDGNTVVIFDESHLMKNADSARSKHGMEMLKNADKALYATATPIDKPEHLNYLFKVDIFAGNKRDDIYRWLGMESSEVRVPGGRTITKWKIPKNGAAGVYTRLGGLFDELTENGSMIKREISLKGVDIAFKTISLPDEAHKMLADIESALAEDVEMNPGIGTARLLMHQRRQLEPYKIPAVMNGVKEALARGDKAIVFVHRVNESEVRMKNPWPPGTPDAMRWEAMLGEKAVIAHSEGTAKQIAEALRKEGINFTELHNGVKRKKGQPDPMDEFQNGDADVIVATIEKGGVGINLDDTVGDRPRTMIIMTAPFNAVGNVQAVGREWRLNTKTYPRVDYYFTDTEVDEWNRRIIANKMQALGASVQGELGNLNPNVTALSKQDVAAITGGGDRPFRKELLPRGFSLNRFDGYTPDGRFIKAGEGLLRQEKGRWITYSRDQVDAKGNVTLKEPEPKQEIVKSPGAAEINYEDAAMELAIMLKKSGVGKASPWAKRAGESRVYLDNGHLLIDGSGRVNYRERSADPEIDKVIDAFQKQFAVTTNAKPKPKLSVAEKKQKAQKAYSEYLKKNPTAIADPITALQDAILELEDNDQDRGREKNDMGWSGSTREPGRNFAYLIKSGWSLHQASDAQIKLAQKITNTHRKQLGTEIPSAKDIEAFIAGRDS